MSRLEILNVAEIEPEAYKAIKVTSQNIRQVCEYLRSTLGLQAIVRVNLLPTRSEYIYVIANNGVGVNIEIGQWVVYGKASFCVLSDQLFRRTFKEAR